VSQTCILLNSAEIINGILTSLPERPYSGKLSLCELELIEPELWFRNNPSAADELAKACILALANQSPS
jgi:hypothetical protein